MKRILKFSAMLAACLLGTVSGRAGEPRLLPPGVDATLPLDFSARVGGRYESNASNSDAGSDQESETFLGATLTLGTGGVLGRDWRWHAGLQAEGEAAVNFPDLGHIEAGPTLGLERKLGLGWRAPRLHLDGLFTLRAEGQSEASGGRVAPSLSLVLPVTEQAGVELEYLPEWVFADSTVFNTAGHELGVGAWLDVAPGTRLAARYGFRHGDVVSYAIPPRPDLVAIREVQSTTDAFGPTRVDYRLVAETHALEASLTQTLTDQLRLSAGYRWETTRTSGLRYDNHLIQLSLQADF
jgi:hypothetical protein